MKAFLLAPLGLLWTHRHLIAGLVRRDVQARYRGSWLGLAWALLTPLAMLLVYAFVFSRVFHARWSASPDDPWHLPFFLFAGLCVFNFFADCAGRAPRLVAGHANLVKKQVFPLEALGWVAVLAALLQACASLGVLLGLSLLLHGSLPWSALQLPLLLGPLALLLLGATWAVAALAVYLRDLEQAMGSLVAFALFATPIFYPLAALPERAQAWMACNPLGYFVEQARGLLVDGQGLGWGAWALWSLAAWVAAALGLAAFQRVKGGFADVL